MMRMRVSGREPAGDLDFLLVAPRQGSNFIINRDRLDVECVDLVTGAPTAFCHVKHAVADNLAQARDADIVANRLIADQAVAAVLGHQSEPKAHCLVRTVDRLLHPVDQDCAFALSLPGAINGERCFRAAGTEQSKEPDHFAFSDDEV